MIFFKDNDFLQDCFQGKYCKESDLKYPQFYVFLVFNRTDLMSTKKREGSGND